MFSRDDTSTYTGGLADEGNQTGWGGFVKPFLMNKIMELPWVKENIASKPITLHFRLRKFIGTMVINLPPSTTDRLWYYATTSYSRLIRFAILLFRY